MNFQEIEKERQKRLASYKKRGLIGLIVILVGILVVALGLFVFKKPVIMFIGLLCVGVGIGIFSSKYAIAKKYAKEFKQPVVMELLKKYYEAYSYEEHGRLPIAEIYNSGLLTRRADRWHMEDLIEGQYHDVQFRTCDVHLEEEHTYTDSKGHTHTEWVTFFRGRWYQFFLNRDLKTIIRIKEKKRIKEMITKNLTKVEVESIDFTDKFMAYALDEHKFFYIFTPVVIEKMIELEKMHKGQFMFSIDGNIVNIGINDNKDYLELHLKTPITEESIKKYETQVNIMAAIISEFRFDTDKFKEQTYGKQTGSSKSNEINVSEDDIIDFTAKKIEDKLSDLDNIIEAKLEQIDGMNEEDAANEIDQIDEELDSFGKASDKI